MTQESQHTEWKEQWRDECLRWVRGFANGDGGTLVIGRNDSGDVVGVAQPEKLLVDLPNKVRDLLGIIVEVNLREAEGKREGWTLETLLGEHSSLPFNPHLANTFFRAGEIEAWGCGIQRVFNACREAGTPEPVIRYQPNDLWLEFPFSAEYLEAVGEQEGDETTRKTSDETSEKASVKTSVETSVKILEILKENPTLTLADVAAQVGRSVRAIEMASSKLVKEGKLEHVGPKKGGHWVVKEQS